MRNVILRNSVFERHFHLTDFLFYRKGHPVHRAFVVGLFLDDLDMEIERQRGIDVQKQTLSFFRNEESFFTELTDFAEGYDGTFEFQGIAEYRFIGDGEALVISVRKGERAFQFFDPFDMLIRPPDIEFDEQGGSIGKRFLQKPGARIARILFPIC